MPSSDRLLLGEFRRTLDDRFRLSIPPTFADQLGQRDCILAKERPGALSLWSAATRKQALEEGVALLEQKLRAGRLQQRTNELQMLGRLLSTRHEPVELAARGRLLIPEGFRDFLGVPPGGEVVLVGAAVCVELWRPDAWLQYLEGAITDFQTLFDQLSQ